MGPGQLWAQLAQVALADAEESLLAAETLLF
jgi:hypothetical protein